jgi:hypothetical protein
MKNFIERFLAWLGFREPPPAAPTRRLRLRITRSLLMALHSAALPTRERGEPLAFLRARYASENTQDVIVAVNVLPFPEGAYVEGSAGANFDTEWSVRCANESARSNAGIFLAHRHGRKGKPGFSSVDRKTNLTVMAPLSHGMPTLPYGAIVVSDTGAAVVVAFEGRLHEAELAVVADGLGQMDVTA